MNSQEVDFLGRWEVGEEVENPADVMRLLLRQGVQENFFVPAAELSSRGGVLELLDVNQQVTVWRYDATNIRSPVAFVSNKPVSSSGFSRVVVFSVLGEGHFNENPIMVALQCLSENPNELVEQLIGLSGQPASISSRKHSLASGSSLNPGFASVHRRSMVSASSMGGTLTSADRFRKPIPYLSPKTPDVLQSPIGKTESLGFDKPSFVYDHSEDQIQKDTILLNYCIGDIESLCADLRSSRSKEGNIVRKIDGYKATEFISVFQKIKLAFNLLGRLNPHISDPNAPDLVHHLFPPLAFLMDASLDLFEDDVAKDVSSPLLSMAAVTLLNHCLSTREHNVWAAAGDYWTLPRNEFEGDLVPYKPLFLDGWSPGYIYFQEDEERMKRQDSRRSGRSTRNSTGTESDYGSDGSVYNVAKYSEPKGEIQDAWRDNLIEKNARIALCIFTREGNNQKELSAIKGEYLEVLSSERRWWKVRNESSREGYVPCTILKTLSYNEAEEGWEDKRSYKSNRSSARRRRSPSSSSSARSGSPRFNDRQPSPAPSLPPPPPPLPKAPPIIQVVNVEKKKVHKKPIRSDSPDSVQTTYSMQDELKSVLTLFKEKEKHLDIHKTPDVFIDQRSTVKEVKRWLHDKGFSERVLKQMVGLSGMQVLKMQKEELQKAFGHEEGTRLDSQITLSRNNTKFTMGKNSELRNILEKARRRSEKEKGELMEALEVIDSKV